VGIWSGTNIKLAIIVVTPPMLVLLGEVICWWWWKSLALSCVGACHGQVVANWAEVTVRRGLWVQVHLKSSWRLRFVFFELQTSQQDPPPHPLRLRQWPFCFIYQISVGYIWIHTLYATYEFTGCVFSCPDQLGCVWLPRSVRVCTVGGVG
jgi:Zn-dependent protease with chaperone function